MGDTQLATLASRQHSLVTRRQARDLLSREQLKHRLATGRLEPYRWGVYRYAGATPSEHQPLMAACLAGGPAAVASHRCAAVLWGMRSILSEQPEITVPWPQWPRLDGVKTHQSTCLPVEHCTARHGVPVTTPARTLVDLCGVLPPDFYRRVVEEALRRNQVFMRDLRDVHAVMATRGRPALGPLGDLLKRFDASFKPGGSGEELDLLEILLTGGLPRPVQQHPVPAGGTVYVLDYAYPECRIGLEWDSFPFHRMPSDLEKAAIRNNALELEGWRMLHFTQSYGRRRIVADVAAARTRFLREKGVYDPHLRESEVG